MMGDVPITFLHTHPESGALPAIRQGLKEGFLDFVVVGGDGTVQSAASGLIGSSCRLGIIPAGSGNGFAEWLGIKKDLRQNLNLLRNGKSILIDTGKINDRPFVNLAGIGIDGAVAHATKNSRFRGFWPYFFASLRLAFGNIHWKGELVLDGNRLIDNFLTVVVANGAIFGYGFHIARDARIDDGYFTVVIIRKTARWRYFMALPGFMTGRVPKPHWMEIRLAKKVEIKPDRPTYAHADGEALPLTNDYRLAIVPSSLHVIVP